MSTQLTGDVVISRPLQRTEREAGFKAMLPHEHGAWVMLLLPELIVLGSQHSATAYGSSLLLADTFLIFVGLHGAQTLLRRRRNIVSFTRIGFVGGCVALGGICGAVSMRQAKIAHLLLYMGMMAFLVVLQFLLANASQRKRYDRTLLGETLGCAMLTSTAMAPAIRTGAGAVSAGVVWAASFLWFVAGIVCVKTLFAAARIRHSLSSAEKVRISAMHLVMTALLIGGGILAFVWAHGLPGVLGCIGIAPGVARSLLIYQKLSPKLPPLKRVGMAEAVLAIWFGCWLLAAIRCTS